MFIHRIFTRIHKITAPINNVNNFNPSNTYLRRQLSTRPIIINNVIYTSTRRNVSFQNFKKPSIEKLKLSDNIPNNYELVYRCTMSSYLYAAHISATIGILFVCIIGIINMNAKKGNSFLIDFDFADLQNMQDSHLQFIIFTSSFILLNIAVLILIRKFPLRIYFNKDLKKYIGIIHGKIPKTKVKFEFNAGELTHDTSRGVLPWAESKYKLKNGKSVVLLDHYFRKPDDMNIMLGYTKL